MRYLAILFLLVAVSAFGEGITSGTCEQCPPGAGCTVRVPAGDGCNHTTYEAWCKDGKWERSVGGWMTLAMCGDQWMPVPFTPDAGRR
jgi:hypothetical protein